MRHVRTLLDNYRRGDKLTDDELVVLRTKMQAIADAVSEFGDLFTLQFAYAQSVADECRRFQVARSESSQRRADRAQLVSALQSIDQS